MRKVRVSIVIPLLTLSALAGLHGCSWTGGDNPAASALRLSGTTGQEALNIVSLAGKDIDIGNNGPATAAILDTPRLLTVDSSGNIYIPDISRIWRVDHATGIITTVAGTGSPGMGGDGVSTEQPLNTAFGVAMDGPNILYFAEFTNNRIRRVDLSANTVTTVIGTGTAGVPTYGQQASGQRITQPLGVFVQRLSADQAYLYFSDTGNRSVNRIDLSVGNATSGQVLLVAGGNGPGFSGDGGPATAAKLNNPRSVTVDSNGLVWIADTNNSRIRRIDAAGIINTVAGTGISGDTGDEGLATSAALGQPFSLAFDPANNVYVTTLNGVRRIDSAGYIHAFAGNPLVAGFSGNNGPALNALETFTFGIAFDSSTGKVIVSESSNHCIRSVDTIGPDAGIIKAVAGNPILDPGGARALDAKLYGVHGFAVDRSGDVYIAENGAHRVRKLTLATQRVTTIAGTGLAGFSGDGGDPRVAQLNLGEAPSLAFDAAGNLYVSYDSNRVRRIDMTNNLISTYAGNGVQGSSGDNGLATQAQLNRPTGIVFDDSGNLYIAEQSANNLRRVAAPTPPNAAGIISKFTSGLNAPRHVVRDNSGYLYVADTLSNRVLRVDSSGNVSTYAGSSLSGFSGDSGPATAALLSFPRGLAFGLAGELYVTDYGNNRVRMIDANGTITTIAGDGDGSFGGDGGPATSAGVGSPEGIAVDASGNIYIGANNRVRRLNVAESVDVDPDTLHIAGGDWITATIQLAAPRDASQVDPDSVTISALDPVTKAPLAGDMLHRASGAPFTAGPGTTGTYAQLKYDRATVLSWGTSGSTLPVRIEGRFLDGRHFSGDTAITIH